MSPARAVEPHPGPFTAEVEVPGDKSLSHRALIFAALAAGTSEIEGLGPGRDVAATAGAIERLGAKIDGNRVISPGSSQWDEPVSPIDCGNSGTTMRLLAGALAARPHVTTLVGDVSLTSRPMTRLIAPIEALGGRLAASEGGTPPLTIGPADGLTGARVEIPIASAQVRSAFELAAIQSAGDSRLTSPSGYRDHTERWLATFGLGDRISPTEFVVHPGPVPPLRYRVPGDASSAAYLWATAAIRPGASVTTPGVTLNPGRIGFLEVLDLMGAVIEAEVTDALLGDPVGTVTVRGAPLRAADVAGPLTVATLDELPLVAVVASFAEGITTVRDAAELRVKESDRVVATCEMVRALGGGAEEDDDGFRVVGLGWLDGGEVHARSDHRIAMAAAVAAKGATRPVVIHDADAAAISWPGFYDVLERMWSSP